MKEINIKRTIYKTLYFILLVLIISCKNGTISEIPNAPVVNVCVSPSVSPDGGTYTLSQSVTLTTSTSGATIRYTTDGSTPSETYGTIYSTPINIESSLTLKAIAYISGMQNSYITSKSYSIGTSPPPEDVPIAIAADDPYSITTDGTYIYLVTRGGETLTKYNANGTFVNSIALGDPGRGITYNPVNGFIYVIVGRRMNWYNTNLVHQGNWGFNFGDNSVQHIMYYDNHIYVARHGSWARKYSLAPANEGDFVYNFAYTDATGFTTDGTYLYISGYNSKIYKHELSNLANSSTIVNAGLNGVMNVYYKNGYLYVAECGTIVAGTTQGRISKYDTNGNLQAQELFNAPIGFGDLNDLIIFNNRIWGVVGTANIAGHEKNKVLPVAIF